ncbi:hypothetical protein D478_22773 [Brevibacillus agri BAB-2500]|nr:hypothetical protein D478_22773 [Brevibacillus agri BAB-2500]
MGCSTAIGKTHAGNIEIITIVKCLPDELRTITKLNIIQIHIEVVFLYVINMVDCPFSSFRSSTPGTENFDLIAVPKSRYIVIDIFNEPRSFWMNVNDIVVWSYNCHVSNKKVEKLFFEYNTSPGFISVLVPGYCGLSDAI